MIPRATYRLQFHRDFTFGHALEIVDYLADLGISHVYSSPIGTARAGSTHGYDVVDPARINPELGGEEGFRALAAALRARGLGIILDIVPNHMAVGGSDNEWWLDVLERGEESAFARWFDIDWRPADPALAGKLLAPFLGAPYAEVLSSGDLTLGYEPERDRLSVLAYATHRFPVRREDRAALLAEAGADRFDAAAMERLTRLYDARDEEGRERLHRLLERQHYRLAWWRVAGDEINWRRFFEITELAGLRVEEEAVFDAVHALPLRLYREGLVDGVRVDHVDGLSDPAAYCRHLRGALEEAAASRPADARGGPAYLVVEKILAAGERLPPEWLTDGTSGYDYMNEASALLHAPEGEAPLNRFWEEVSGRSADFADEEHIARLEILDRSFSGQLESAVAAFHAAARSDLSTRDLSAGAIRRALRALLAVFPAYRTYGTGDEAPETDAPLRARAAEAAKRIVGPAEEAVIDRILAWLAGEGPGDLPLRREAVRRFQQLSAPVSAKAVEDTAFYRYGRLLSRTDVGFDPARFAADADHFARASKERLATFPNALLATATHDHKQGEDVRARLAVLSEVPDRWTGQARLWLARPELQGVDPADSYRLLQTLAGAWPLDLDPADEAGIEDLTGRAAEWQRKALREAKLRSSWTQPDELYERRCEDALRRLFAPASDFPRELHDFVTLIAPAGAVNGIAQAVLRCTVPGVPDCYQGTEFWDFSLVDPDNRRPVDFESRSGALRDPRARDWRSGALKQKAIGAALQLRQEHPKLFARGTYERVRASGPAASNLFAFTRSLAGTTLLVAVLRNVGEALLGRHDLTLPQGFFRGTCLDVSDIGSISVEELFQDEPYALRTVAFSREAGDR